MLAVVLAGGDPVDRGALGAFAQELDGADLVVAADSGLHLAAALGLAVDVVVGDFDSAAPEAVEAARSAGAVIERHPTAKDETDLDLALRAACDRGATRVVVLGLTGGRLDHFVANALLLASPRFARVTVEAAAGAARLYALHGPGAVDVAGEAGDLVTLLAVGGPARGITTGGLRYALTADTLDAGSSRGVSNVMTGSSARVALEEGTLLVIRPRLEDR
jgi:thiamine pyrophosphokinase